MPIGAYVHGTPGAFRLIAMLADESGERMAWADEALAAGEEARHAAEIAQRMMRETGAAPAGAPVAGSGGVAVASVAPRVVVTRPRRQAEGLLAALQRRGVEPIPLPTIRIEPGAETTGLDTALFAASRREFAWLVFTSANAVEVVASRLAALGIEPGHLDRLNIAAIGEGTASAARKAGLSVALVPAVPTAEGLAVELTRVIGAGAAILYPRSAIVRDHLPNALRRAGAEVTVIDAYQTVAETEIDPRALARIRERQVDAITFHSPSSVRHLQDLLGDDRSLLADVAIVCAGPVTAEAAREAGFRVTAVSMEPGDEAVADAVVIACRSRRAVPIHA
jgi:uroporphyrinogen-III synthase